MRNLFTTLSAIALLVFAVFMLSSNQPALAADLENGAKIFSANCAACHSGGGNLINANKTLKKEVLEKYEMKSLDAVTIQVTKGKNAMPAFGGRLNPKQIEDVASYVLDQAEKGW